MFVQLYQSYKGQKIWYADNTIIPLYSLVRLFYEENALDRKR